MTATPGALLVTPDAQILEINLPANTKDRLTVMRAVIRCDRVDVVPLTDRMDMWIDDEGLYNHGKNPLATLLARRYGFTWQPYHGPVLITGGADENGDTVPLSRDKLIALLTALDDAVS